MLGLSIQPTTVALAFLRTYFRSNYGQLVPELWFIVDVQRLCRFGDTNAVAYFTRNCLTVHSSWNPFENEEILVAGHFNRFIVTEPAIGQLSGVRLSRTEETDSVAFLDLIIFYGESDCRGICNRTSWTRQNEHADDKVRIYKAKSTLHTSRPYEISVTRKIASTGWYLSLNNFMRRSRRESYGYWLNRSMNNFVCPMYSAFVMKTTCYVICTVQYG